MNRTAGHPRTAGRQFTPDEVRRLIEARDSPEYGAIAKLAREIGRDPRALWWKLDAMDLAAEIKKAPVKTTPRQCIGKRSNPGGDFPTRCTKVVQSTGPGHRMCDDCRKRT
mgnify:FL=1